MYKNILVMTDFSKDSDFASQIACEIAKKFSSKLYIMHVGYMDPGFTVLLDDEEMDKVKKRMDENVIKEFEKLQERVPCLKDVEHETIYRRGVPYEEGLKEAETGKYDLLILGSHGKSSIKKFFYGSTTAKLTRRSPISTLITRADD
jgi:nucleotide-binding universal stress UspA family protein